MATRADSLSILAVPEERVRAETAAIPWFIWMSAIGVTSAVIGGQWDIAWHRSIGRDAFLTPPHIAIYLCGIIAAVSSAYLILATTFGKGSYPLEATVNVWGFRGPLGAFLTAWGGVAMLTSASFDDWWHAAYGLDVKIVSPPHILLIGGILTIQIGTLVLILGYMNRAEKALRQRYNALFLYVGGMILLLVSTLIMEFTNRPLMHNSLFYRAVVLVIPVVLTGLSRASDSTWSATIIASIYTTVMLGFQWILPLFPAEPKLGPVYQAVNYFVPPQFPLLFIVPALALDMLGPNIQAHRRWIQALIAGSAFFAIFLVVQWPFADFLMSPGARNWFFGAHHIDFGTNPNSFLARSLFRSDANIWTFWQHIGLAALISVFMTRLGIAWGDWMRQVQR